MRILNLLLLLCLALPPLATAADPDARVAYPVVAPVRERVFGVDDQSAWTLRRGEDAVPLAVVPTSGRTIVALAGGWLILGPDLDLLPSSFDLLGSGQPAGTPWAQAAEGAVVSVTGTPGSLAVLYPETAVWYRQPLDIADLSFFTVTDQGFLYVQGRRTSGAARWGKEVREGQPLPFFASDVTAAADGTAWAADSLQARPWRLEDGFWRPLDLPKSPGRLTTLAPFPDSSGYFAGGPGWVGSFSADGTAFWIRDKDFTGQPLPLDVKVRSGTGRLYLWSAQARKLWCWGWNADGPVGTVGAWTPDRLPDLIRAEIVRLQALGSVPEAQAVAQYGYDLAQAALKLEPFSPPWSLAAQDFAAQRQALKERVVGAGVFTLNWESPFGRPLATWTWEPDAEWTDVAAWRVAVKPYWEGRAFEPDDFRIALSATRSPWPGTSRYFGGPLRLPSWMNLEFRPEGTDQPVHWTRVLLPTPPEPYDLPVE